MILITRPEPDASYFEQMLQHQNCRSIKHPLTEIIFAPAMLSEVKKNLNKNLNHVQMVLATSANALRASLPPEIFSLPIFVVGEATARQARRVGFAQIMVAQDDMASLARGVSKARAPSSGALLYLTGHHRRGDLAERLTQTGFEVRICELYEARAVDDLAPELVKAFRASEIDVVSFFSLRAAEIFSDLAARHHLTEHLSRISAVCLASAAARHLAGLGFGEIRIAAASSTEAMCQLIASC